MKNLLFLLLGITIILLLFSYCGVQKTKYQAPANVSGDDYEEAWKKIDSLVAEGLPKSALEETESLLEKARKDNNPSQTVKALIYKGKFKAELEEDGLVKAIYEMEQEIANSEFPIKPVLQSMVAEMYNNYLLNNIWKFRDRTTTVDFQSNDILTWTPEQVNKKSMELYNASIQYDDLKGIAIQSIKPILNYNENDETHRPTLYDFLLHRALDFYLNERTFLTEPAYKFYIDQPEALGKVNDFLNYDFETRDEHSLQFNALLKFQELIAFHTNDEDPTALIDANLKRLKYAHQKSVLPDKEELYLATLQGLQEKYEDHPSSTEIAHAVAMVYYNRGQNYRPSPTEANKYDLRTAFDIAEKAIQKYPDSYGAVGCRNLQKSILQKSLNVVSEKVNIPGQPILAKVDYKNIDRAYVKILHISDSDIKKMGRMSSRDKVNYLNNLDPINSFNFALPDDGDYQKHAVEFKINGLETGRYAVMVADNEQFGFDKKAVSFFNMHVSNLSIIHRNDEEGKKAFFVLDRTTGEPLQGVSVEFYSVNYNYKRREYEERKIKTVSSDKNGLVISPGATNSSYKIRLTKGTDYLHLGDNFYDNYYEGDNQITTTTTFFIDRGIYRPGQTIYFKGIVLQKGPDDMPKISKSFETKVTLFDANFQKVTETKVRTNEYGTFNGSFILPQGGLLGRMHLHCSDTKARKYFQVEEYKRPKFEVTFDKVKGSYKLGEEVSITGNAKAFAGNNIDGAKVSYRVVRQVRFPYWRWWYWGWYNPYNRSDMEITNGYTQTDENGQFEITFEAIPDKSIPAEQKPQFNYVVQADVIDITGETRSGSGNVSAGYIALNADISVPGQVNKNAIKSFTVNTTNLNGEFEPASCKVEVHLLKSPSKIFLNRYWSVPDKQVMDKNEFDKAFPYLAFEDEDQHQNWAIDREVGAFDFNTNDIKEIALGKLNLETGVYRVTFKTQDKFGEEIESIKHFTLYDLNSKQLPSQLANWQLSEVSKAEPGESVPVYFGSSFENGWYLVESEKDGILLSSNWDNPKTVGTTTFNITEKHRGNIHYNTAMVRNNRVFMTSKTISVPWSNKDLKLEYGTFRNKLYPGQDEEWIIKVSGPKGEKVAAEMLVGMYDASLDEFASNNWYLNPFPFSYSEKQLRRGTGFNSVSASIVADDWNEYGDNWYRDYSSLNWFGFGMYEGIYYRSKGHMRIGNQPTALMDSAVEEEVEVAAMAPPPAPGEALAEIADEDADGVPNSLDTEPNEQIAKNTKKEEGSTEGNFDDVQVRTNLKETVFFFPELMTDKDGNVIIKFKMNEALTKWKFMGFAHTPDLKYGFTENSVVTQKDLMIVPNVPRFLRESDEIYLTAKVSNLTENDMNGAALLEMFNAITMKPVDALFGNTGQQKRFEAKAGQSAPLSWKITVPEGAPAVVYRVIAKSDDFSDGEENAVPVLTNRMMVTETMPLPVRGNETKQFTFSAMEKASRSNTLTNHKLTLEFTSNPAWYAVQALPYLMEYPYECTEQIFNRYYANSLASNVANSHPRIQQVFEQWKNTDAMLSNLSKNQELKSALLEETPWVLNAQSEEEQKKRIGLLFDLNQMANQMETTLRKLVERQSSNGGFSWFPGGRDNWYITQYIVEGMGHLDRLGVKDLRSDDRTEEMMTRAVRYIDNRMADYYQELVKRANREEIKMEDDHLYYMAIHYLYARSFFLDQPLRGKAKEAHDYFTGQAEKYWLNKGMYMEGMIALSLQRQNKTTTPAKIVKSLKERSLNNEEMGMYWKYNRGWNWYQLPIETHALMIEVFDEVANDAQAVDDLKVWMLKNKQTTHWKTTKATSSAVYALLLRGDNWLLEDAPVQIRIGDIRVEPIAQGAMDADKEPNTVKPMLEAGTGYFKTDWNGENITANMANVEVTNPNKVVAWGAVYWQYFEQLDKIESFEETPLTINKKVFKEENSPTGPVIKPVDADTKLEPGDKLKVRIELRVDRDMEYVHMKDMRASGLEPINVISQYKWQGGLGYYESTRDASTNFFFSYLRKGTYVFEYPLRVNHRGNFSNGITTIRCMYAPEFTSHSEGIRLTVE
ncbi:MAG: alpha-2-macroglobulin family protein [Bacteroidota bacterium]